MKVYLYLLLPLVLLSGCVSETTQDTGLGAEIEGLTPPTEDSAEASLQYVIEAMKAGKPVVLWNALPSQQQDDINDIVRSFAATMDRDVWNQVADLIRGLQSVLDEKSEFFANYPLLGGEANGSAARDAVSLLTAMLKTILDGAADLEALQTFDGRKFTASTGTALFSQLEAMLKLLPPGMIQQRQLDLLNSLTNSKIETLDATAKSATLNIIAPDGRQGQMNFMKISGKWVPMDLVQNWDETIRDAKDKIKNLSETIKPVRNQLGGASNMVNEMLAALRGAQTQEQFNGVLNMIVGQALMRAGMLGSGPPQGAAPSDGQPESPGSSPAAP